MFFPALLLSGLGQVTVQQRALWIPSPALHRSSSLNPRAPLKAPSVQLPKDLTLQGSPCSAWPLRPWLHPHCILGSSDSDYEVHYVGCSQGPGLTCGLSGVIKQVFLPCGISIYSGAKIDIQENFLPPCFSV